MQLEEIFFCEKMLVLLEKITMEVSEMNFFEHDGSEIEIFITICRVELIHMINFNAIVKSNFQSMDLL